MRYVVLLVICAAVLLYRLTWTSAVLIALSLIAGYALADKR